MWIFWCILLAVFAFAEILTPQLTTIWFALGSAAALAICLFGLDPIWQFIVFIAVSAVTVMLTRRLAKKFLDSKRQPTNYDRYLGDEAVAVEEIDNMLGKGQVNVRGAIWSAKSADGSVIPKDTLVTVERIEGVKMIVKIKK